MGPAPNSNLLPTLAHPQLVNLKPCRSTENRAGPHYPQTSEPRTWSTFSRGNSLSARLRPNDWLGGPRPLYCSEKKRSLCTDHHICVDWSVVAHSRTNVQVEHANDMILQGLKPRIFNELNKFGRRWLIELLWQNHPDYSSLSARVTP